MTQDNHPEYPHLPVLSVEQSVGVLQTVGLGPSFAGRVIGVTRATTSKWWNGRYGNPNRTVQIAVSALAYRSLRAVKHHTIPNKAPKRGQFEVWMECLRDGPKYDRPLSQYRAEELLPTPRQIETNPRTPNGLDELL